MSRQYPKLPGYDFSWRSLQVEPIPQSGERITLGIIVKGADHALMAVALAPAERLREIYGSEFGTRLSDALSLCIKYAKLHYENNPLASDWRPPLEGFYLGEMRSSLSENIEDGLMRAAMQCSSFAVGLDARNLKKLSVLSRSKRQTWGKDIQEAV